MPMRRGGVKRWCTQRHKQVPKESQTSSKASEALAEMAEAVSGSSAQDSGPFSRRIRTEIASSSPKLVQSTLHSATIIFSQLRHNPQCMSVLWDSGSKANKEICKKIILQCIFPEDARDGGGLDVQIARLLHALFSAEVAGSTDLNRLLREDSLACVLSAAYGRRQCAESFVRDLLEPIFAESLRDSSIRIGSTAESYAVALLDATLQKSVVAICSRIEDFPVGFVFASSAIANALKTHPLNVIGVSLSATSAVGAIVFLRYIVPFVVQYGQSRHPAAQRFFADLGNMLQKACSSSKFGPNHKNESLNATLGEVSKKLEEAFARLSSMPLPAPTEQAFVIEEPPCAFDAVELGVFVSLLSSMQSTAPLPSSVSDSAVRQTLHQLEHELSQHAAAKPPPQVMSLPQGLPSSVSKQHAVAAPSQISPGRSLHIMNDSPLISRLTFWWCNDLFKIGYSKPLTQDDLWPAPSRTLCSSSVKLFENAWKLQLNDSDKLQRPGVRVFKAAWKCFGRMFLTSIILQIIWLATALALPSYFLRQMISFANNPEEPLQNGILYAVFMFVAQLTSVTCLHNQVCLLSFCSVWHETFNS
jgi:hypothetical protein